MVKQKKRDNKQKDLPLGGKLFELLKNIVKLQSSEFFRVPVDAIKYNCQNYYDVIKQPMDLLTMKTKLLDGDYETLQQFEEDFQMIIKNCMFFNPNAEHAVRKSCDKFNASFYNKFNKLKEEHDLSEPIQIRGLQIMEQKEIEFQKRKMIDLQPGFIQKQFSNQSYELNQQQDKLVKKIKLSCNNNKITIQNQGNIINQDDNQNLNDDIFKDEEQQLINDQKEEEDKEELLKQLKQKKVEQELQQQLQDKQYELEQQLLMKQQEYQLEQKKQQQQQQQFKKQQEQQIEQQKQQQQQQLLIKQQENQVEQRKQQQQQQQQQQINNEKLEGNQEEQVKEQQNNEENITQTLEQQTEPIKEEQIQKVIFTLDIKTVQQKSHEYYVQRIQKYFKLSIKKLKQLNEFLINIQDNFESLNFLIEMSQKEYEFDELNKLWVLVSQLVMWFSHHRSNLDIFTIKNNNKQFYKYVTQLAKSIKKILKYQIRANHNVYRLNKEAFQLDLQDFQGILDMEARQNNIKLSIPQEVRQQMYLNKQMKSSIYNDHSLMGQAKFSKPLKYIEDRNKNRKVLLEKIRNQQNLIDMNKSKLTQSINTFNQDLVDHKNKLYMKINTELCVYEEEQSKKIINKEDIEHNDQQEKGEYNQQRNKVQFSLKKQSNFDITHKAKGFNQYDGEYSEDTEIEREYINNEQINGQEVINNCFNEYQIDEIKALTSHNLFVINKVSTLTIPPKIQNILDQKKLVTGSLSLEKIIFSSLFSQVKITSQQKQKVQMFIDKGNNSQQVKTKLLFRDQLLKGYINQNGQLFEEVLKFQELVYFRVKVQLEGEGDSMEMEQGEIGLKLQLKNCISFELAQEFENLSWCGLQYEHTIREFGQSLTKSQLYNNFVLMLIYRQLQEILVSNLSYCDQLNCYYSFDLMQPPTGNKHLETQLYLTICTTYSDIEKLSIRLNSLNIFDVQF